MCARRALHPRPSLRACPQHASDRTSPSPITLISKGGRRFALSRVIRTDTATKQARRVDDGSEQEKQVTAARRLQTPGI
uniref:Uncharacterized protein n=1 Tax=Steinernema glaseri TaxID=37863 RepID=A0A1I7ZDU1_9BILA